VLSFETRSGVLTAAAAGEGVIRLDFPADPPAPIDPPDGLIAALGVAPLGVYRGVSDVLVEVGETEEVRKLSPDLRSLAAIPARGVIVTAAIADGDSTPAGADFVSRCFYPAAGIDEDPVTGSAHCTLASFWCPRLGRPSLVGWQASSRGGRVGVELAGDRVLLTGRAVTVLRGQLV
jgi:predicted PhzF superfamily epimerase YddE/YHI9